MSLIAVFSARAISIEELFGFRLQRLSSSLEFLGLLNRDDEAGSYIDLGIVLEIELYLWPAELLRILTLQKPSGALPAVLTIPNLLTIDFLASKLRSFYCLAKLSLAQPIDGRHGNIAIQSSLLIGKSQQKTFGDLFLQLWIALQN